MKIRFILLFLAFVPALAFAQRKVEAENIHAKNEFNIRTGINRHQFTAATDTISSASTHAEIPTAKSVWDLLSSLGGGGSGGHVIANNGTAVSQRDTLNLLDDGHINFTIVNTTGNTTLQADLNQMSATTGQVLRWTGSDWVPHGINLYDVVTTGGAVSSQYNQIIIDTLSTGITLNLPACNAPNDGVSFTFIKSGPDTNAAQIEPAGSEIFNDNTTTKTLFSQGTGLICTCSWNGSAGRWFFQNM